MSNTSNEKKETVAQTFAREFNENIIQTMKSKIVNGLSSPDVTICLMILIIISIVMITFVFFIYNLSTKLKKIKITNIMDLFTSVDMTKNMNSADSEDFIKQCKYVFLTILILFFALLCVILMNNKKNRKTILAGMVLTIGLMFVAMFYYNNSSSYSSALYTSIMNKVFIIISFLIAIIALALTYKLFANKLRNQPGMIGFILDLLFLLPCLFSDFLEYWMRQFKITSNSVFILFILEILLIIAYITIPTAVNSSITKNAIPLLPDYAFLSVPKTLPTDMLPTIKITDLTTNTENITSNQKYSISMWIYMNQQSHNSSSLTYNIFSYGSSNFGMKPQISYSNSSNNQTLKDTYQVTCSGFQDSDMNVNGVSTSVLLELTGQKWNNFVFNYGSNNNVELYVNGDLVRVFSFGPDQPNPKYDSSDVITIGDLNGLDGAICNVTYYTEPLTDYQVRMMYKLLSGNNPPVLSSIASPSWSPAAMEI